MAIDLAAPLERLAKQLTGADLARAGADAGAEVMRQATAAHLGGDLTMSGLRRGGAVDFDTSGTRPNHVAFAGVGGTFALADRGRRSAVPAQAKRGSAISTPWGPRANVSGSTWAGFGITASAGPEALRAAGRAVVDAIEWG